MTNLRLMGNTSNNFTEVINNRVCINPLYTTNAQDTGGNHAGWTTLSSQLDGGSITGTFFDTKLQISELHRLRMGCDTILLAENFAATAALNTSIWSTPTSTMTVVLGDGFLTLNGTAVATASKYATLQSWRMFPIFKNFATYIDMTLVIVNTPVSNSVVEWGVGFQSTNAAPTDGAFFRINANGHLYCVLNFNGVEIISNALPFSLINENITHHYLIATENDICTFWIDDIMVASLNQQLAVANTTLSCNLPVFVRNYTTASTTITVAQQVKVGLIQVSTNDMQINKCWSHVMAGSGAMAYQGTTGMTVGQTAQYAISAAPSNFTPTTTTTPAGSTGFGGTYNPTINGLAVTTDYVIASYQITAGTSVIPGKTLYVTGFKFDALNAGATNGAALLGWIIGINFGCTNLNESGTAESATTKAVRRIYAGAQTLAAAAVIGTQASPTINLSFSYAPIAVQQGEYIQVFLRFTTYASTTSQTLNTFVTFTGYWE